MPSSSPWNPSSWSTKRRLAPDRLHSQPTPSCTGHACVPGTASQHNHLGTLINSKSTPALFLALLSLLTPGLARAQGESSLVLVPYVPAEVRAALPTPAQVLIYNPHQDRDPVHLEHLAVTVGRDMIGELFLDHELPGGREYGEIQACSNACPQSSRSSIARAATSRGTPNPPSSGRRSSRVGASWPAASAPWAPARARAQWT